MTPPDPQLKGAWYPGGFNPRTYRVKTRFQNVPVKCGLRRYVAEAFDAAFSVAHAGLVRGCSVLVGLHPDQATNDIVDVALAHRKPFAVVPCCVYSHLWPERVVMVPGAVGRRVESTDDMVAFLLAKHPNARVGELDFKGRNKCVYMTSSGYEGGGDEAEVVDSGGAVACGTCVQ